MTTPAEETAIERLCNICYHRCLWLPATSRHGIKRVTYATSSNFHNEQLPVMLFIPPQFSTRYHIAEMDKLAQDAGVRLLGADRYVLPFSTQHSSQPSWPGFGGSDQVDLDLRVQVWLETVPILLQKVNVKHVSLFCHSAGAIYLLNTLHQYRDILDPRAPNAILIAPWVPPNEAKTLYTNILKTLPAGVIKMQHGAAQAIRSITPSLQWSSSLSANLIDVSMPALQWSSSTSASLLNKSTPVFRREDDSIPVANDKYGCDVDTAKKMSKLLSEYIWAEETKAINDEALMCLHKAGPGSWAACEDYDQLVKDLTKQESELQCAQKLRVSAFFAESDELVGVGGQNYVEACFTQPGVADFIGFTSCVKPGTDHNTIMIKHTLGPLVDEFARIGDQLKM